MLKHCPVARTDAQFLGSPNGSWVVSRYRDVLAVLNNPDLFSSRVQKGLSDERQLIPFDVDPPLLLEYRRFLERFFTPKAMKPFEPLARDIAVRCISRFADSGRCDDIVAQLARPFASEVQWTWLVGVDDVEHERVEQWVWTWLHKHFEPEFAEAEAEWVAWIEETIARRRRGPRREDLIDALLNERMNGRFLDEDEIIGIMMLMILGGVPATADTIANVMLRLAVYPDLQTELRNDLSLLPRAIEEFVRLEPPSSGGFRRCTRDTSIDGVSLKTDDQLYWHIAAANRDESEFPHPHDFDLNRERNRHLGFGAGHHRCLGRPFARQNLRVVFEEILTRMRDIRLVAGDPPRRAAAIAWGVKYLPLEFTPASAQ
jgi:cytochrome P450